MAGEARHAFPLSIRVKLSFRPTGGISLRRSLETITVNLSFMKIFIFEV